MYFEQELKWHRRFLEIADSVSTWSKDQSRGVGCVIVGPNKEIRSTGYNGFPRNINDNIQARHERPLKYKWTEHAERNAVYNAARMGVTVQECTMYSTLYPCADCARAIVQSGITQVITREPDWKNDRFAEDFKITKEMLAEAKIVVRFIQTEKEIEMERQRKECYICKQLITEGQEYIDCSDGHGDCWAHTLCDAKRASGFKAFLDGFSGPKEMVDTDNKDSLLEARKRALKVQEDMDKQRQETIDKEAQIGSILDDDNEANTD